MAAFDHVRSIATTNLCVRVCEVKPLQMPQKSNLCESPTAHACCGVFRLYDRRAILFSLAVLLPLQASVKALLLHQLKAHQPERKQHRVTDDGVAVTAEMMSFFVEGSSRGGAV